MASRYCLGSYLVRLYTQTGSHIYTDRYTPTPFIHSFIHSFILNIYIAPLQGNYSEALPTLAGDLRVFSMTDVMYTYIHNCVCIYVYVLPAIESDRVHML